MKSTARLTIQSASNQTMKPLPPQFLLTAFLEHDIPVFQQNFVGVRGFLASWLLFAMVITCMYRSKLTSMWTFPVYADIPQTFRDLVTSNYQYGFMKHGDSAYNSLKASNDIVYKTLLRNMQIITGMGLECLEKVVSHNHYACIGYDFAIRHLQHRNLSDEQTRQLTFAEARTYNIFLGFAVQSKSFYKDVFWKYLSWARQSNLYRVWEQMDMYNNVRLPKLKWWGNSKSKTDRIRIQEMKGNLDSKLTIRHVFGVVLVAIIGFVVSFVVFVAELLRTRRQYLSHICSILCLKISHLI